MVPQKVAHQYLYIVERSIPSYVILHHNYDPVLGDLATPHTYENMVARRV